MTIQPHNPDWLKALTRAERNLAKIDEPWRRMRQTQERLGQLDASLRRLRNSNLGRNREALEGIRRQIAGPSEQLARYVEQNNETLERIRRQIAGPSEQLARYLEQLRESLEGPARQAQRTFEQLNRLLEPYDVAEALRRAADISRTFERALRNSLPTNWREFSFENAERAHRLVVKHGVPIVWVPNGELTQRVVQAADRETAFAMLYADREQVLDDLESALAEIDDPALDRLVEMARKAVATSRKGEEEAAQALASAVFTAGLADGLGLDRNYKVHERAGEHRPEASDFASYRTTLVLDLASRFVLGWGKALPGYNRNETLHTVAVDQYTPEHSLASLMAVTVLLREAQEVFEDHRGAATANGVAAAAHRSA